MWETIVEKLWDFVDDLSEGIDHAVTSVLQVYGYWRMGHWDWKTLMAVVLLVSCIVTGVLVGIVQSILPVLGPILLIMAFALFNQHKISYIGRCGFIGVWVVLQSSVALVLLALVSFIGWLF